MKSDPEISIDVSAGADKTDFVERAPNGGAKSKDAETYARTNTMHQGPGGRYPSTDAGWETIQRMNGDTATHTFFLPKAPGSSESFVKGSRDTEIDSIMHDLEINKPVFLWGCGGIGKSEIAIKVAKRFENHSSKGAYFIHYTTPFDNAQEAMEETVLRMPLSGFIYEPESGMSPEEQRKAEYKKRIHILTEQYAGALLVIDNFDWPGKTLDDLRNEQSYQEITSIGLNLLFTTRNEVLGTPEVKELSREDLLQLIRRWYADPRITDQQLLDLIEAVDGHTLTVDIIAKTLSRSRRKITPEMMLECLKSSKLSEVKYPKVTLDTVKKGQGVDRVQHREQKSAQIYEHLKALFDLSGLDEQMKIILCCATLLPAGGMDCQLFESCLEEGQIDAFDYLLDCGWLKNSEDNVLTIHPVIRTVCEEELPNAYDSSKLFLNKLYSYAEINANYDYSDLKESEMRTSRLFQIIMAYKRALLQTKALGDSESVTTLNQQYNDLIFIYGQLVIATRGFGVKRSAKNYSVCYTVNESENIHYSVFIISEYAEYPSLKKHIRIDPVPSSVEKDGASWKRNFYIPRTTYDKQNVISLMYQSDTNTMYVELAELFDNMFVQKTILTPIEVGTFKSSETTYRVINILGDSEGVLKWSVAEERSMHELGKKIQVVKLPEMNSSVCSIGDICLQTPYFCFTVMYKESQMASNTMVANCYANGCDEFPQNTDLAY